MQVQPVKHVGLVADLAPNIRLMKIFGHFLFRYSSGSAILKKLYASLLMILSFAQFGGIILNLMQDSDEVNELTSNTITTLLLTHSITKLIYFALNSNAFYRYVFQIIW